MKNKIILTILLGFFLIGNVIALDSLGTFQQGETIRIAQICDDATYITISSITYPNSTVAVPLTNMTSAGSGEFYYSFTNTSTIGRYDVRGISDGCSESGNNFATYFNVTPSGMGDNVGFYIILIALTYGVGFIGFFGRNMWVSIIGGFSMMIFGIYIVTQGITIYINWVTNSIAALSIALGGFFALYSLIEWIQEM